MKLYNSLTRQKEEFIPRNDKQVKMFVCGPTVYDFIHIGNARTFTFFDVVAKFLRYDGYDVEYIQNITDIDDRIIVRAEKENRDPLELAKDYENKFMKDMKDLEVDSVNKFAKATDHISQVISQVKRLVNKGHAYLIEDDGYYFDLATFPEYGKLSGRTSEMANDSVSRIDVNEKKRNRGDFCLWKLSKLGLPAQAGPSAQAGEPSWESELGAGRPGWHIEDTAITEHYFGPQYDLHGGGIDLMFPHHEAEITQQESASGKKPFVKYWLHGGFLVNKERKMSKSEGNFATLRELLERYPVPAIRLYLLSAHYRSPLNYSTELLDQARAATNRIADFIFRLQHTTGNHAEQIDQFIQEASDNFHQALRDDFSTPEAIGAVFTLIRRLNPHLTRNEISKAQADKAMDVFVTARQIMGFIPEAKSDPLSPEIEMMLEQRTKYREAKDWERADIIRREVESKGYQIDDTSFGSVVYKR